MASTQLVANGVRETQIAEVIRPAVSASDDVIERRSKRSVDARIEAFVA
jgi:hypothetical protein